MADPTSTGDPRAMRALATALRKDGETVAGRAAWLARRAGRMRFEGPAAEDLKQDFLRAKVDAERVAGELREIANRLLSGAARVETDLAQMGRR